MLTANLDENEETLCELWDEEQIEIKPHSRLYHLEPIGVGAPLERCTKELSYAILQA
jgi:hypothetical protein